MADLTLEELSRLEQPIDPNTPLPISMRDIDKGHCLDMEQHMADACPACGGFSMCSGDYICWGICYRCYDNELTRAMLEGVNHV